MKILMWLLFAFIAMLCLACMQLLFKQLSETLEASVILGFLFGFSLLFYVGHNAVTRPPMPLNIRLVALLVIASVLSYAGNLFMVRSLVLAPNPGYTISVISLQALVVTVGSVFLFGSSFSWLKALGVVLAVAGVVLLALDR